MSLEKFSKSDVEIICPCCKESIYIELDVDLEEVGSDEREMGTETQYEFLTSVECYLCENIIEIKGEVWEYPENVLNDFEIIEVSSKCNKQ
ncbi:hypothetical protein PTQ21_27940 [Paenibacillus marchantiae]|uniref:hypothetical protein n=1 Tax=Paenibacillus marchantiae TaxID=3026433 RepID=UPI00237C149F|nr:hypothetical protein [Paenibacillus marchantiae]WDQ32168.1 hypothetical protein PTQ21_27940 [Paenibacillus marchantiae]